MRQWLKIEIEIRLLRSILSSMKEGLKVRWRLTFESGAETQIPNVMALRIVEVDIEIRNHSKHGF